jgi:hypothetical protein
LGAHLHVFGIGFLYDPERIIIGSPSIYSPAALGASFFNKSFQSLLFIRIKGGFISF